MVGRSRRCPAATGPRRASPGAASARKPRSGCWPSRWVSSSASGCGKADFDRLRCLELLIVKGWANKDVAKYLKLTEQAVASYKFQAVGRLKEMARRSGLELEQLGEG